MFENGKTPESDSVPRLRSHLLLLILFKSFVPVLHESCKYSTDLARVDWLKRSQNLRVLNKYVAR